MSSTRYTPLPGQGTGLIDFMLRMGDPEANTESSQAFHQVIKRGFEPSTGHDYTIKNRISADGDLRNANSEVCVVPGATSTRPITSGTIYPVRPFPDPLTATPPTGFVQTTQSKTDPNIFTNTTTKAHPFRGTIQRKFTQQEDGVYATTTGKGRAGIQFIDDINQVMGPAIFNAQDAACSLIGFGVPGQYRRFIRLPR